MNLFGTVLTHNAPNGNYGGERAENRTVVQKIRRGRFDFLIYSPETIRNALRNSLAIILGDDKCNRQRLHNEDQLAVKFKDYPDPDKYADDFFMGWLVAAKKDERKNILKELKDKGRDPDKFRFKRDSILRMNMAVSLAPYRQDTVFRQAPQDLTPKEIKNHKNVEDSQLLHREVSYTAFQYPFAFNMEECRAKPDWTKALLKAIGELNDVAGNRARSYFEMAPASIVLRLTPQLVAGYETYGFRIAEDGTHSLPEIIDGILHGDYPGKEFYLGGKIVKDMDEATRKALEDKGVTMDRNPQRLLETVANQALD